MEFDLRNKKALILGSSSGIGEAIAKSFAAEGCDIYIASRNKEKLVKIKDQILSEYSVDCRYGIIDLTKKDSVDAFISSQKDLNFDILVNNTGGPPPSTTSNTSDDVWAMYIQSIILNIITITNKIIPHMKRQKWGRVITVTSSGVVQPIENLLVSNTLRPAITGYMKTLSNEVSQYGITVNTVMPGRIMTDRTIEVNQSRADKLGIAYDEAIERSSLEIPIKRYGKPEEFGDVICFLASAKASYITGSNVRVDGGLIRNT